MKKLLVTLLLVQSTAVFGQLEDAQLDSLKKVWTAQITTQMNQLGIGSLHEDGLSDYADSVLNLFERDTFLVNNLYSLQLEVDYSTFGMVRAINDMEAGYDALLNKYYGMLMGKLQKEDREMWRETQRNWIKFRDSEARFNGLLTEEKYSGGGTIQQLIFAEAHSTVVKQRVFVLIDYLIRM